MNYMYIQHCIIDENRIPKLKNYKDFVLKKHVAVKITWF